MLIILSPGKWQLHLVDFEIFDVFLRILRDYISHTKQICSLLREAGIIMKQKSSKCATKMIGYLSRVTRHQRLEIPTYEKIHQATETVYKHCRTKLVHWPMLRFPSFCDLLCLDRGTAQQQFE